MRVLLVGPEREENLSLRYLSGALLAAGHQTVLAPFDRLDDLGKVVTAARAPRPSACRCASRPARASF
jgi:hypothetical protein